MIIESLILLAFIGLLAALFHFKIKHIAARPEKPLETPGREIRSRLPAAPGRSPATEQPPATPGTPELQTPDFIQKMNTANPRAVASMIAHWVQSETNESQKKPGLKRSGEAGGRPPASPF